ncbi:MAG: epoxyqueuosine reductase [Candidatus Eiseniibacteriota bacterium]|nr:MAG: epoxyqueuosine reductase [Candidatus Eisenbacteria bacterium]
MDYGGQKEATDLLRNISISSSMSTFGAADFRGREDESPLSVPFSLKELPYAVCVGFRLSDPVMDSLVDRPTRTYQYHYRQVNLLIDQTLLRLMAAVHELGFRAFPVPSSQIVDWDRNTGHLSHRFVGKEAGLGWIGKNNLLVSPRHGARVRYGSLFTDMPLETSGAVIPEDCGDCQCCAEACPVGAIGASPGDFDLQKCTEMLKVFKRTENIGSMICGLCVKACRGRPQQR